MLDGLRDQSVIEQDRPEDHPLAFLARGKRFFQKLLSTIVGKDACH